MRVLYVEDDLDLASVVKVAFLEEGIIVDDVSNTKEATQYRKMQEYDVIILDKVLPDVDGVEYCSYLREEGIVTPILMLSAQSDLYDRVHGLEKGADDYLSKPFHFIELITRVKTLSKRSFPIQNHILRVGDLSLNLMSREVKILGKKIEVRNNEFNILALLLKRKNHVVTKTEIVDYVWNSESFKDINILNVTMYNLRKKIEIEEKNYIKTIRGVGYIVMDNNAS